MIDTRAVSNRSIGQLYRRRWEINMYRPEDLRRIDSAGGSSDCLP